VTIHKTIEKMQPWDVIKMHDISLPSKNRQLVVKLTGVNWVAG